MNNLVVLHVTVQQLDLIGNALGVRPYNEVKDLIAQIITQANNQPALIQSLQIPAPPAPPAAPAPAPETPIPAPVAEIQPE